MLAAVTTIPCECERYMGNSASIFGLMCTGYCLHNKQVLRPDFTELESTAWLEHGDSSERQWTALRDATPQAEAGVTWGL